MPRKQTGLLWPRPGPPANALIFEGAWATGRTYAVGSVVTDEGKVYLAQSATGFDGGGKPSTSSSGTWRWLADGAGTGEGVGRRSYEQLEPAAEWTVYHGDELPPTPLVLVDGEAVIVRTTFDVPARTFTIRPGGAAVGIVYY